MNRRAVALVVSHLLALAAGMTWKAHQDSSPAAPAVRSSTPDPSSPRPASRSSSSYKDEWSTRIHRFPRDFDSLADLLVAWCRVDPVAALDAAEGLFDPDHAVALIRQLTRTCGEDWPELFFDHLPRSRHYLMLDRDLPELAAKLAATDPDRAFACIRTLSPGTRRALAFDAALVAVPAADFARVSRANGTWIATLPPGEEREHCWTNLAFAVSEQQGLSSLLDWLPRLTDPATLNSFAYAATAHLENPAGLSRVLPVIANLDPPAQQAIYRGIAKSWKGDPALLDAAKAYPDLAAELLQFEVSGYTSQDSIRSAALRDWVLLQPSGEDPLVPLALRLAWAKDPARVDAFFTDRPAGPLSDAIALAAVRHYLDERSPADAKKWHLRIADPDLRAKAGTWIGDPDSP